MISGCSTCQVGQIQQLLTRLTLVCGGYLYASYDVPRQRNPIRPVVGSTLTPLCRNCQRALAVGNERPLDKEGYNSP